VRPYVFVIDRLGPYGAQRVCVTLLEEFAKAGHRVVLITYADDHPEAPLLSHSIERIKVPRSDAKWAALGQVVFSLRQTLRTLKPAAVLAFMPLANICTLMATRGSGIPVYVSEHNIPSMAMRLTSFRSFCLWIGMWFWYPRASGVITVSQDVKTALIAYLRRPRMHVRVIYNPVDYKRLSTESPAYIQASADIARWHASIGKPDCLVIVGALKEAKGHSIAIDALKLLPARYQLVFVGEGPLRKELLNRADIAGLGGASSFRGRVQERDCLDDPSSHCSCALSMGGFRACRRRSRLCQSACHYE